jgi:hypothetical protein
MDMYIMSFLLYKKNDAVVVLTVCNAHESGAVSHEWGHELSTLVLILLAGSEKRLSMRNRQRQHDENDRCRGSLC